MNKDSMQMHSEHCKIEKNSHSTPKKLLRKKEFTVIYNSDVGFEYFIQYYEEKWIKPTTILKKIKRQISATKQSKEKVGEKLKLWIENNWVDFQRNMKKKKFSNLFGEIMDIISARKNLCKQILELIESKEQTPEKEIFHIKQDRSLPVKDFIPIFFQNSDQQIAKFLTFIEFGYWIQIENREWLSSNYTKQNKYELAPHIMLCIDFANYLTGFVHTALLSQEQVGERVKILKRLIRIAKVLLDLGNYSTATTIIFALKSSFIERLTKTFYQLKLLHETDWNLLVTLSQLLDITRLMSMYEKFLRTYPFVLPCICVLTKKISTLHEMIHDDFQNGVLDIKNRNLLGAVLVQIRD